METDDCQEESYYECIASQVDMMQLDECSNKCIPNTFSILETNFSTPFCQEYTENEYCALEIVQKILNRKIASDCKKSCSALEYFAEFDHYTFLSDNGEKYIYHLDYELTNQDYESMVYEEYFLCDTVDMIASVGGTLGRYLSKLNLKNIFSSKFLHFFILGIFIGFSMTGTVKWIFSYLRRCCPN